MNIIDAILSLIPGAKFAAWKCQLDEYQGEPNPIQMGEYLIDWNPTNVEPCPSWEQVQPLLSQ